MKIDKKKQALIFFTLIVVICILKLNAQSGRTSLNIKYSEKSDSLNGISAQQISR